MKRVAHIISEFSAHEAMGRTIAESVDRITDLGHHLVTTRVHDGADRFASVNEVGGSISTFVVTRSAHVASALAEIEPDVVHLHGGALTPLWAHTAGLRQHTLVQTVYGWPKVPSYRSWRASGLGLGSLRRSNVLRTRVLIASLVPDRLVAGAIRRSPTRAVLTPDAAAALRLADRGVEVTRLGSGAEPSRLRATHSMKRPTILFAGRAEHVRGIATLIRAFEQVTDEVPDVRLRLLLIPAADLGDVIDRVRRSACSGSIEVCTEPISDLEAELAQAQVGAWPFHFDYTTSPPAMAVAEAMAVGLPVVATEVGCIESIATDGFDADLVPVADSDALADRIVRLLCDAGLWASRSAAARDTIARSASWSGTADVTRHAYGLFAGDCVRLAEDINDHTLTEIG